jgi:hypothetical protein
MGKKQDIKFELVSFSGIPVETFTSLTCSIMQVLPSSDSKPRDVDKSYVDVNSKKNKLELKSDAFKSVGTYDIVLSFESKDIKKGRFIQKVIVKDEIMLDELTYELRDSKSGKQAEKNLKYSSKIKETLKGKDGDRLIVSLSPKFKIS